LLLDFALLAMPLLLLSPAAQGTTTEAHKNTHTPEGTREKTEKKLVA